MILEILISTMNRKDLSFLDKMFVNNQIKDFHILIINQTTQDCILRSDFKNIRVINSFEYGLSKSRNLAIKNATGDICLIADDDVEYSKGFEKIITDAYELHTNFGAIIFNSKIENHIKNPKYLNHSKKVKKIKECISVCSVEISFKRTPVQSNNILFNELLGINSCFESGEEFVYLNEMFNRFNIFYEHKVIVKHENISTGSRLSLMEIIPIYAVQFHLVYANLFYYKVVKFVLYLLINKKIRLNEVKIVFETCVRARNKYINRI